MKLNAQQLKDTGIEIIEEVHGAIIEAPIELDSIKRFDREDFLKDTYNTDFFEEKVYTDNAEIFFSLYENDYLIIESSSLEEIYNYLEERFG